MWSPLIGSYGTNPGPVGRRSREDNGLEGGEWVRLGLGETGRMTSRFAFVAKILGPAPVPAFLFDTSEANPVALVLAL